MCVENLTSGVFRLYIELKRMYTSNDTQAYQWTIRRARTIRKSRTSNACCGKEQWPCQTQTTLVNGELSLGLWFQGCSEFIKSLFAASLPVDEPHEPSTTVSSAHPTATAISIVGTQSNKPVSASKKNTASLILPIVITTLALMVQLDYMKLV